MRRLLATGGLVALTLLVGAACSGRLSVPLPPEAPMAVTPANHEFAPVRGETFSVVLKSASSGGYQWHLMPDHDERVARLIGRRVGDLPATHPPLAGRSADEIFDFEAVGPGATTLQFKQYRAWEGPGADDATAAFRVAVP